MDPDNDPCILSITSLPGELNLVVAAEGRDIGVIAGDAGGNTNGEESGGNATGQVPRLKVVISSLPEGTPSGDLAVTIRQRGQPEMNLVVPGKPSSRVHPYGRPRGRVQIRLEGKPNNINLGRHQN